MQHLKVALVQADLIWEDCEANLQNLDALIAGIEITDLIVLPEMFATGFTMNPQSFAVHMQSEAVQAMCRWSEGRAICGSLAIEENGRFYNRFLWAEDGEIKQWYDKRHRFGYAGEDKVYTAGDKKIEIRYKDFLISPLVCYDLRFPVWCRNSSGSELMVFVANWPESRIAAWEALLRARAIENQCFVIGVNRVGTDGNGIVYNGCTVLFGPDGSLINKGIQNQEIIHVELDRQVVTDFRNRYPFLKDMDSFSLD